MKRFTSSAFSALSALILVGAIAPTAQALPQLDPAFKLQTLRLSELDTRNKGEESSQPYYYPQSTPASAQETTAEADSMQTTEPVVWEAEEAEEETASLAPSLTDLRHESLDRS